MDDFFCFIEKWKVLIEVLYYLVLIVGVIIAYFQLRANTKAQQALRSPLLYIYCPEGADPINGLVIRNEGNVIATNIIINVSEKINLCSRTIRYLRKEKVLSLKNTIPLFKDGKKDESIFGDSRIFDNVPNITVKITYHSPFHRRKMKIKRSFKRR